MGPSFPMSIQNITQVYYKTILFLILDVIVGSLSKISCKT